MSPQAVRPVQPRSSNAGPERATGGEAIVPRSQAWIKSATTCGPELSANYAIIACDRLIPPALPRCRRRKDCVMNSTTSQPEGSTLSGDAHTDLIAANFPGALAVNHWACGMPLSYVQEMADRWLRQHDQLVRIGAATHWTSTRGTSEDGQDSSCSRRLPLHTGKWKLGQSTRLLRGTLRGGVPRSRTIKA